MDFPLQLIPEAQECYDFLVLLLHKNSLRCSNGHSLENCYVYKRGREPLLDYRCKTCGKCFNLFSGTILQGTKYNLVQIIQCLDGIIQDVPISQISRKVGVGRKGLMINKHKFKMLAEKAEAVETEYLNWDKVFEIVEKPGKNQGWKIKNFIEKLAFHKPYFLYWAAFLKNIEDWAIEDIPGENSMTRLILNVKKGGCYALTRRQYISIDPKSGKKHSVSTTSVDKLGSGYFSNNRRNK